MSGSRPTFTYLGHATVRCDLPTGEVVLVDPWLDGNPSCPVDVASFDRLDAILVTHAHSDHVGDLVSVARATGATVVASFEVCTWLGQQGLDRLVAMNLGGTVNVLGLKVSMVRADHSSGFVDGDGRLAYGGPAAGYMVRLPGGFTFYHAGDTALFSDMQLLGELHRPELGFVPIGDVFTMGPYQAARACRLLGLRTVVPIHWGTFSLLTGTPDELRRELSDLGVSCQAVVLQPGESY